MSEEDNATQPSIQLAGSVPETAPAPPQAEAMATPPPEDPEQPAKAPEAAAVMEKAPEPPKHQPPKQPGSGVTVAIIATVVIVVALSLLATYAYLQTNK